MKFARIVFRIAAVYGILSLLPVYFLQGKIGIAAPPPVTHPEFFYGFLNLAMLWQFVFLLIAKDPTRYRPIMCIAILEKAAYTAPVLILYALGQAQSNIVAPALVDPIFAVLFIAAYYRTREAARATTQRVAQ
jgi:hypothetical protein